MLQLVWLVEFGIVLGCAAVFPYIRLKRLAYCERCSQWVTDAEHIGPFTPVRDPKALRQQLEAGEFVALEELQPTSDDAAAFTYLDLHRCSSCETMHLLTMRSEQMVTNKKGKVEKQETVVLRHMFIDPESRLLIEQLAPESVATAPAGDTLGATGS